MKCVVPENIHIPSMEGHWDFKRKGGSLKPNFLKESVKLNLKFQRGGGYRGAQTIEKPSVGVNSVPDNFYRQGAYKEF